jgi:hypothetical protein
MKFIREAMSLKDTSTPYFLISQPQTFKNGGTYFKPLWWIQNFRCQHGTVIFFLLMGFSEDKQLFNMTTFAENQKNMIILDG